MGVAGSRPHDSHNLGFQLPRKWDPVAFTVICPVHQCERGGDGGCSRDPDGRSRKAFDQDAGDVVWVVLQTTTSRFLPGNTGASSVTSHQSCRGGSGLRAGGTEHRESKGAATGPSLWPQQTTLPSAMTFDAVGHYQGYSGCLLALAGLDVVE